MKTARATSPSDQHLLEALGRFADADNVELKMTVSDSDQRSAVTALGMDVLDAEIRQVVFFDTQDLRLDRTGVVVRARRTHKGGDTVVKLRPMEPSTLPRKLRHASHFKIEVDVMPGRFVCSGSFKGKVDNADVKDVLAGRRPIRKLFLPEQRAFYEEHAPQGLDLDSLKLFGPINVAKLQSSHKRFKGRGVVAEMWFYPDGSRILELSTKCACDEALEVLAEARATLTRAGISPGAEQVAKTRKALEYFSRLYAQTPSMNALKAS